MLSFLKKTAARAWETTSQDVLQLEYSGVEGDPVLSVDVEELRDFIPQVSWHRIAQACSSTVGPVYAAVRDTVHNDIDSLVRLFGDLENTSMTETERSREESISALEHSCSLTSSSTDLSITAGRTTEQFERKRRKSSTSEFQDVLENPSHDPIIPTIVITPCPSESRDRSGWVPFQDASFGNQLVVPTHPVVNDVFPPLIAKASPVVERWRFVDGHWWALLPPLEEQMQRGMFSRPIHHRRRKSYSDGRSKYYMPRSRPPSPSQRASNAS